MLQLVILLSLACSSVAIKLDSKVPPKEVKALDADKKELEVSASKVQAVDKVDKEKDMGTSDLDTDLDSELDAPISKLVVMTEINSNYIKQGLFQNWMHFAKPYLNESHTVIFDVPEPETQQEIERMDKEGKLPFKPHFLDENFKIVKLHQTQHTWQTKDYGNHIGTQKYKRLMSRRPHAIRKLLEKGSAVLLVDLDTVWAKNPFDRLAEAGTHDLYLTKDDTFGNYCGCFLYFRPTEAAVEVVKHWEGSLKNSDAPGNQHGLNQVLHKTKKNQLDLKVLNWGDFPPGNQADKHPEATIYHANWMIGADHKVSFFKLRNMWYETNKQANSGDFVFKKYTSKKSFVFTK